MKTPVTEDLDEVIKSDLKADPLSKKSILDEEKRKIFKNRSITFTEYHLDFIIKKAAKEMMKTGKNVSFSKVIRDIIDAYIKDHKK